MYMHNATNMIPFRSVYDASALPILLEIAASYKPSEMHCHFVAVAAVNIFPAYQSLWTKYVRVIAAILWSLKYSSKVTIHMCTEVEKAVKKGCLPREIVTKTTVKRGGYINN